LKCVFSFILFKDVLATAKLQSVEHVRCKELSKSFLVSCNLLGVTALLDVFETMMKTKKENTKVAVLILHEECTS
jgi:hypothetical protein